MGVWLTFIFWNYLFCVCSCKAGHYYISKTSTKWGKEENNCRLATPKLTFKSGKLWHYIEDINQIVPKKPTEDKVWINYIQQSYTNAEDKATILNEKSLNCCTVDYPYYGTPVFMKSCSTEAEAPIVLCESNDTYTDYSERTSYAYVNSEGLVFFEYENITLPSLCVIAQETSTGEPNLTKKVQYISSTAQAIIITESHSNSNMKARNNQPGTSEISGQTIGIVIGITALLIALVILIILLVRMKRPRRTGRNKTPEQLPMSAIPDVPLAETATGHNYFVLEKQTKDTVDDTERPLDNDNTYYADPENLTFSAVGEQEADYDSANADTDHQSKTSNSGNVYNTFKEFQVDDYDHVGNQNTRPLATGSEYSTTKVAMATPAGDDTYNHINQQSATNTRPDNVYGMPLDHNAYDRMPPIIAKTH